jgi:hypothetical protein
MEDLIQRLDSWLKQNRPEYYAQLLPGLSDEELTAFEKTLGVALPDEFKLLYQWRNGQKDELDCFIHNLAWLKAESVISRSISEFSIKAYDHVTTRNEIGGKDKSIKRVTFLYNSASTHAYILDLTGIFGQNKGLILSCGSSILGQDFILYNSQDCILYQNAYKWVETTVVALEKGFFEYKREKGMIAKDNYEEFLKANNPGYPMFIERESRGMY